MAKANADTADQLQSEDLGVDTSNFQSKGVDNFGPQEIKAYAEFVDGFRKNMAVLLADAIKSLKDIGANPDDFDRELAFKLLKDKIASAKSEKSGEQSGLITTTQTPNDDIGKIVYNFVAETNRQYDSFQIAVAKRFPIEIANDIQASILLNLEAVSGVTTKVDKDGKPETIYGQLARIADYFETFVQQAMETLWFKDEKDLDLSNFAERTTPVPNAVDLRNLRFNPTNAAVIPKEIVESLDVFTGSFQAAIEEKFRPYLEELLTNNKGFFVKLFEYLSDTALVNGTTGADFFTQTERDEFHSMSLALQNAENIPSYISEHIRKSNVMDMLHKIKFLPTQKLKDGQTNKVAAPEFLNNQPNAAIQITNLSIMGGYKAFLTSTTRTAEKAQDLIKQGLSAAVNSTHVKGFAFDLDRKYFTEIVDPKVVPGFDISTSSLHPTIGAKPLENEGESMATYLDDVAKQLMSDANADSMNINVVVEKSGCYHIATHPKAAKDIKVIFDRMKVHEDVEDVSELLSKTA
jgi:hypothetical protein